MVSFIKASFTKRKSNFTYTETDLLLRELERNKDTLLSGPGVSKHRKRSMWDNITAKINSIGEGDERTMEEVRKKWSDMQCLAKRKYAKGKQELNEFEVRVLAMRSEIERIHQGSFDEHDEPEDSNFEFDTLSETDIQIKQENIYYDIDHPPVHFDENGDNDDEEVQELDDYPETPIPFDGSSRKRKSNFTLLERNALIEGVKKRRKVLTLKTNDTFTHEKKRQAWDAVTMEINDHRKSGTFRTTEEVRKKWNDMQSLARRKIRKQQKALGNENVEITDEVLLENLDNEQDESMDAERSHEATEDGEQMEGTIDENSGDHSDILERVMASAYAEEVDRDEVDLLEEEEEDADDSNDSNCSEIFKRKERILKGKNKVRRWTPGKRRRAHSSTAKPRKNNFSNKETHILLDEIFKRRRIIFSPNLDRRTAEKKRNEWAKIAQFVSEKCKRERRSPNEVRKKWSDLYTRANKSKVKIEGQKSGTVDTDIDKVNRRVLFILNQRDEELNQRDKSFDEEMFGKAEEFDDDNSKPDTSKPSQPTIVRNTTTDIHDTDSGIIIVKVQGSHKKGDKVVDVINLKNETPPTPTTPGKPSLVIENVASIDEKMFSSMDTHELSPDPDDKTGGVNQNGQNKDDSKEGETGHEPFIFKKRKGQFSIQETNYLLDQIIRNKALLMSKVSIPEKRAQKWKEITKGVNKFRWGIERKVEEVKKKWYDLQVNAKKKKQFHESMLDKLSQKTNEEEGNSKGNQSPQVFQSRPKLMSLLGTGAQSQKVDMATQADCDSNEDEDENGKTDDTESFCDQYKLKDSVTSVPNILTGIDLRVLNITSQSDIANYAAIDHNYEARTDKYWIKQKQAPAYADSVSLPSESTGLRIESVVSQADLPKTEKRADSEDSASTVAHISADIFQQRLSVERKRLSVERRRLTVEQEKLRLLRRLVQLEEDKAAVRKARKKKKKAKKEAKEERLKKRNVNVKEVDNVQYVEEQSRDNANEENVCDENQSDGQMSENDRNCDDKYSEKGDENQSDVENRTDEPSDIDDRNNEQSDVERNDEHSDNGDGNEDQEEEEYVINENEGSEEEMDGEESVDNEGSGKDEVSEGEDDLLEEGNLAVKFLQCD